MQETTIKTTQPAKRYYWLKLKRDFFKRHDIRIIESQENGKDYVLFYLKMLVESIDHEGELRFSEAIPYDEKMLAIITNTNIDIVRAAMKMFVGLQLIEVLDDATIYMSEVQKLVGSETAWAMKKRKHREKQKLLAVGTLSPSRPPNVRQEIDKEKDKETEKKTAASREQKVPVGFDAFWAAYPRKVAKPNALRAFEKAKPDDNLLRLMLDAIERDKVSPQWQKDGGQYIPHPASWLNAQRWADEIPIPPPARERKINILSD